MKRADINNLLNILQTQGFKAYATKHLEILGNVNVSDTCRKRIQGKISRMEAIFYCATANSVDYDKEMMKTTRLDRFGFPYTQEMADILTRPAFERFLADCSGQSVPRLVKPTM